MSQYRKILLILPPEPRVTPAYHRAQRIALATKAELHVCVFDHSPAVEAIGAVSPKVSEVLKWDLIRQRELWLMRQADHLHASGVPTVTEVIWGAPIHERIADKVRAIGPDVVVKDVQREGRARRLLFTPLDRQLLRVCPAPLLLVRGGGRKMPRRVIAAVDTANALPGTESLNDRIVQASLALALQCDAKVELVHVFENLLPVVPGEVLTPAAIEDAYEQVRRIHRERFEAFATRHGVPPECRHFLYGQRARALLDFATQPHRDVLVLGTTHRTGLDRLLMGSTAEELLEDLRCDVLAVKPDGFGEEVDRLSGPPRATHGCSRRAHVAARLVG